MVPPVVRESFARNFRGAYPPGYGLCPVDAEEVDQVFICVHVHLSNVIGACRGVSASAPEYHARRLSVFFMSGH